MNLTPEEAANRLERISLALGRNIQSAEMDTAIQGRGISIAQTLGPFKTAWLKKFRPGLYSRKFPNPPADPGLINAQSGLLNRSWEIEQSNRGANLVTAIFNRSESAKHIANSGKGRSRMMHRPVEQRIAERIIPLRIENLKEAVRKAIEQS